MRHQFSIVVENKAGVLARILGVFSARGMNIESLKVEENGQPGLALITMVSDGDEAAIERVARKIEQQVRVLNIRKETYEGQLR